VTREGTTREADAATTRGVEPSGVETDRGGTAKAKAGFTLIELLVVAAVIGLLAALLMPTLARGKSLARRSACMNNARQIGFALRAYLDEFRSCYPGFQADADATLRRSFWDYKLLDEAGGATRLFMCPANAANGNTVDKNWMPSGSAPNTNATPLPWPNLSYGYNGTGTAPDPYPVTTPEGGLFLGFGGEEGTGAGAAFASTHLLESQIVVPADMIAIADYDPWATDDDNDDDRHPEMLFAAIAGRHARGANVLFCDAHVEYNKTNRWTAVTAAAWRRWNYDHQAHLDLK